jgi:hypothetical protein
MDPAPDDFHDAQTAPVEQFGHQIEECGWLTLRRVRHIRFPAGRPQSAAVGRGQNRPQTPLGCDFTTQFGESGIFTSCGKRLCQSVKLATS